jgi:predicted small lipoprotein YifL
MKSFVAILALAALAGCSTHSRTGVPSPAVSAQPPTTEFKPDANGVTVRSVHGEVQYKNGAVWDRLEANMVFTNGVQIRTGHDSEVYLGLGRAAVVKLVEDSECNLEAMMVQRHIILPATTRTGIELRQGALFGSFKKLPPLLPKSSFQIRCGGLTVEDRGGDVAMNADGTVRADSGEISVQAGGKTYTLRTGQSFDPKKNKVVSVSAGHPVDSNRLQPGSPSLSPFERGLQNARHGFAPDTGN